MSVIVKGMKMPKSCCECKYSYCEPISGLSRCNHTNLFIHDNNDKFPESCPLVGLPEHHGRLIDENEVQTVMFWLLLREQRLTWNDAYHAIQEMNAVLEAEDKGCT